MPNSAVISKELNYIESTVRRRYRPAKWRAIIQAMRGIPKWAEKIEVHKVIDFASLKPLQMQGGQLPTPNIERSPTLFSLTDYGCAYQVYNDEIDRAQRTGIRPDVERPMANARAAEQLLDEIAATGCPFGTGLGGIGNNGDVATVTAVNKAGGGTTWPNNATLDETIADVNALIQKVATQSLENYEADTVVFPQAQFFHLLNTRNTNTDRSALALLQEMHPGVRFMVWDRFSTLGAGTTPRAMAFDSRSEEVARVALVSELTSEPPRKIDFGVHVAQSMKTGGVIIKAPKGIAYMDAL